MARSLVICRDPLQAVHKGLTPPLIHLSVADRYQDMPASKGKALPLLRIINAFLRFLPRIPADLVFRGRVHQFASSVISVADKSAINMRGDYNDIKTTWEETLPVEEAKEEAVEADGDVSMQGADKEEVKDDKGEANGDCKLMCDR